MPGPPATSPNRRQRGDERIDLRDVVDVRGGYLHDERHAARIGDEVVLGARLAAIDWVRSSFFPPRADRRAIDDGPALVEPAASAELREQGLVQALPYSGALPAHQAAPARAA